LGIANSLIRFPQTRGVGLALISTPILLLVAWFLAGLINRVADLAIDRFAKAWETSELGTYEDKHRRSLRISTIANVVKGLKAVLIYLIALFWVLQVLNIAPVSILAFSAVLALAVSFAAQNLVKDLVNGFLILLEDQYAIGDRIVVNQVSGLVENLNLRVTQLRSDPGNLITIPNSQIGQVENMTRTWSRSDFQIEVAYDTDVDRALEILREVAETLAQDPEWGPLIINPKELLGVEGVSHSGLVLRIWLRTLPSKQWDVGRELRRRIKIAFDRQDIRIGVPQQALTGNLIDETDNNGPSTTQPNPEKSA
jgi:small conductance mechanosensitive channel